VVNPPDRPTRLCVRGVTVDFGERRVLDDLRFYVAAGEIVSVLGPSGSGKSTLLRVIAGLTIPHAGTVIIDGIDVSQLPPHRRRVGMMFQDDVLFPHLDVGANVGYGLKMHHRRRAEIDHRVTELLGLVDLPGYERRRVATLSGGEQQRVALARALAPEPSVLLLDEPLSALDRELHDRLVVDLRAVLTGLGITAVHVTHDEDEAAALGDRALRLSDGALDRS
jgi:thiamine transport system ATP-binding protein